MSRGNNNPNRELTWDEAVYRVLQDEKVALHYTQISDIIVARKHRTSLGATPAISVSGALRRLVDDGKVTKVERGVFALSRGAIAPVITEDVELVASGRSDRLSVAAYGLYWKRDAVDWNQTIGHLWGSSGGINVDFAGQDAIYLLQSANEIVYVGQTQSQSNNNGLYGRLRSHHTEPRKTDRWDTFSWFGFRPVNSETGRLTKSPATATLSDVINAIEAILIEGLMPKLNMRSGEGSKEWLEANHYFQVQMNVLR